MVIKGDTRNLDNGSYGVWGFLGCCKISLSSTPEGLITESLQSPLSSPVYDNR